MGSEHDSDPKKDLDEIALGTYSNVVPRQPRLIILGYPYHIVLRGNNRSAVFYQDKDRRFFLECLKLAKEKTKSKIYAYCLMDNHVHFLIEPSYESGLAEMMQALGRQYVQYINKKYQRTGTLWEGRYKSSLVDRDRYLAACSRYIELNPVRVGIVSSAGEYVWSSFRNKTMEADDGSFLDKDPFYFEMGKTDEERQENYREWVCQGSSEEECKIMREAIKRTGIVGSDTFHNMIQKIAKRPIF